MSIRANLGCPIASKRARSIARGTNSKFSAVFHVYSRPGTVLEFFCTILPQITVASDSKIV